MTLVPESRLIVAGTAMSPARFAPGAPSEDGLRLRLSEVIAALSHALDLTEGQPVGHAQRTCAIGMEIGARLGIDSDERQALMYALLLKDAGCSHSAARMSELFAADDLALKRGFKRVDYQRIPEVLTFAARHTGPGMSKFARSGQLLRALRGLKSVGQEIVETRCERGAAVVSMIGCPPAAAQAVRSLDEHWDGAGKPFGLKGEQIPLLARIACLSQVAEIFHAADGLGASRAVVAERRGRWFDPAVADAFLSIPDDHDLWRMIRDDGAAGLIQIHERTRPDPVDENGIDLICEAFADVIDAKSPYTARHSEGVATYAAAIGGAMGMDHDQVRSLRRAGLLHDIGKLGISNSILDKPGKLTDTEYASIQAHPRFTYEILSRVSTFSGLAPAAAAHHERLDGKGYHLHLGAEYLDEMARILAVADVFEALTADRPYRGPMDPEKVLGILQGDVGTAFDGSAVEALTGVIRDAGGTLPY
jgi:HD-GYP domain-containing protein (c-di-GMP phosphodiesterase class II)